MSTSLLVTRMEAESAKRGLEIKIWACSEKVFEEEFKKEPADCVLVGPQIRYLLTTSDILSPLALTLRSGSFSLNATNVASINELSPYALGFCLFCYLLVYRCKSHALSFDIDACIIISI